MPRLLSGSWSVSAGQLADSFAAAAAAAQSDCADCSNCFLGIDCEAQPPVSIQLVVTVPCWRNAPYMPLPVREARVGWPNCGRLCDSGLEGNFNSWAPFTAGSVLCLRNS